MYRLLLCALNVTMNGTFSAVKTGRSGTCNKDCSLNINTHAYDVSLRWNKNKYGGVIRLNYNPTQPEITFSNKTYTSTGTVSIDFLNHAGFMVDNIEPDAVVHMVFMNGGTNNAEIVHILVPFALTSDQGSYELTSGSDLINTIANHLKSYQPAENDPSTQLTDINIREFIPKDADYYYAKSHTGDKYIIVRKIQGLRTADKEIFFEDLFQIGVNPKWSSRPGTKLNIDKYYTSDQKINVSTVYKGESHEGFTGMNILPMNTSRLYEGFTSSKESDDIYIDCKPVGVDEETKPVTVRHERSGMLNSKDKEMLVTLLLMIFGILLFCGMIYGIYELLKTQG